MVEPSLSETRAQDSSPGVRIILDGRVEERTWKAASIGMLMWILIVLKAHFGVILYCKRMNILALLLEIE